MSNRLSAKAGGLADVSASLVSALYELGADVHVALPHYRKMFHVDIGGFIDNELLIYKSKLLKIAFTSLKIASSTIRIAYTRTQMKWI